MVSARRPPPLRLVRSICLSAIATSICSSWLPLVVAKDAPPKSAADYFVDSLPGAPDPPLKMYAGHIDITPEHHGNLFFWFFQNRHIANKQRTLVWLNGGPGCSSMDGALMEIGPYRVNEDLTLNPNNGSWDEFSNVLFVDNPVGTGFSYVDGDSYVEELDQMADQMIQFLEKWYTIFPEYDRDDLYIAGESYAGQHIPYVAKAILHRNSQQAAERRWNIKGLLIGNGWISPLDQYPAYASQIYDQSLVEKGSAAEQNLKAADAKCKGLMERTRNDIPVTVSQCEDVLNGFLMDTTKDGKCLNMYDVRLKDTSGSCGMNWPPDLPAVTKYLRQKEVVRALNIDKDKKAGWTECNSQVGNAFRARRSKPAIHLLPELLEQMPIMLFSGEKDLICNHIGTENLINNLEWNGATGMETDKGVTAPRRDWTFEGAPAGIWQNARNLTYLLFYNASHMVPFDYPRRTRDMFDRFIGVDIASIGGKPTDSRIDGEQGLETSVGGHPNSTVAQEAEAAKLEAERWSAYKQAGEAALVIVVLAAAIWGFFIFRARHRRRGYSGVLPADPQDRFGTRGELGLDGPRHSLADRRRRERGDIEAAADFDEAELDELSGERREKGKFRLDNDGEDSDGEYRDATARQGSGQASSTASGQAPYS